MTEPTDAILIRHYGRLDDFQEDANVLYQQGFKPILVTTVTAGPLKNPPMRSRMGGDLGLDKQRLIVVYERNQ